MLPSQSPSFPLSFHRCQTWSVGWKQSHFFPALSFNKFLAKIILFLCMLSGRHKLTGHVLGVVKKIVNKMRIWQASSLSQHNCIQSTSARRPVWNTWKIMSILLSEFSQSFPGKSIFRSKCVGVWGVPWLGKWWELILSWRELMT